MSEERFEFGKNWRAFLSTLSDDRIERSVDSLKRMLGVDTLAGKTFLDIGCGSGLFSLAACKLGARVISIDYDVDSVECALLLREQYMPKSDDSQWKIQQGSVLDESLMESFGTHDIVYSWGVLHHTGEMDRAIDLAQGRVKPGGQLFISIYNDQGKASARWLWIKQLYNRLPRFLRPPFVFVIASYYELKFAVARLIRGKNPLPLKDWKARKLERGMSVWYDWVDWVGGLPFEVATPERIEEILSNHGFQLERLETVGNGWGCNEFVFQSNPAIGAGV